MSGTRSKPDHKRKNRCIAVAELPVRLVSSTPKAQYERLCRRRGSRLYHTHPAGIAIVVTIREGTVRRTPALEGPFHGKSSRHLA